MTPIISLPGQSQSTSGTDLTSTIDLKEVAPEGEGRRQEIIAHENSSPAPGFDAVFNTSSETPETHPAISQEQQLGEKIAHHASNLRNLLLRKTYVQNGVEMNARGPRLPMAVFAELYSVREAGIENAVLDQLQKDLLEHEGILTEDPASWMFREVERQEALATKHDINVDAYSSILAYIYQNPVHQAPLHSSRLRNLLLRQESPRSEQLDEKNKIDTHLFVILSDAKRQGALPLVLDTLKQELADKEGIVVSDPREWIMSYARNMGEANMLTGEPFSHFIARILGVDVE